MNDQIVHTIKYCNAMERMKQDWFIMISEFIDNSIANFERYNKDQSAKIVLDIIFNNEEKSFTFIDNCFGMNQFPYEDANESKEKEIEKKEDLLKCFDFFVTNPRSGKRKYGYGMKSAIYWIGKSWEVWTYVKNLNEFAKVSSSIKNSVVDDIHPQLNVKWFNKQNSNFKMQGTKIKVWDFSATQNSRFPEKNYFNTKYSKELDRQNYLIMVLASRYKIYLENNLEINFKYIDNEGKTPVKYRLDKTNFNDFIFNFEDFNFGYENINDLKEWKKYVAKHCTGGEFELNSQIQQLKTPMIGYFTESGDEIENSIFFDLLLAKKPIRFKFQRGEEGYDGTYKIISIELGLISFGSSIQKSFVSFQDSNGTSHFLNDIEITTRPIDQSKIPSGRGGAAYRRVAQVYLEQGYIEVDPNKRGFDRTEITKISRWVNKIVEVTKLVEVSKILTNMTNALRPSSKKKSKSNQNLSKKVVNALKVILENNTNTKIVETNNSLLLYEENETKPYKEIQFSSQDAFIKQESGIDSIEVFENYISEQFPKLNPLQHTRIAMIFWKFTDELAKELRVLHDNKQLDINNLKQLIYDVLNKNLSKKSFRRKQENE